MISNGEVVLVHHRSPLAQIKLLFRFFLGMKMLIIGPHLSRVHDILHVRILSQVQFKGIGAFDAYDGDMVMYSDVIGRHASAQFPHARCFRLQLPTSRHT
jgi:hypothetical protein